MRLYQLPPACLVEDATILACYEKDEEMMREVRGETICIDVRTRPDKRFFVVMSTDSVP